MTNKTLEKPRYTKGEELFNMITHIVGGGLGFVALLDSSLYHQCFFDFIISEVFGEVNFSALTDCSYAETFPF